MTRSPSSLFLLGLIISLVCEAVAKSTQEQQQEQQEQQQQDDKDRWELPRLEDLEQALNVTLSVLLVAHVAALLALVVAQRPWRLCCGAGGGYPLSSSTSWVRHGRRQQATQLGGGGGDDTMY